MGFSLDYLIVCKVRLDGGVDVVSAKLTKGDGHVIYANTIFQTNASEMCLSSCVEKLKPFRRQYPRVEQNVHTQVFNTAAHKSEGRCVCRAPDAERVAALALELAAGGRRGNKGGKVRQGRG